MKKSNLQNNSKHFTERGFAMPVIIGIIASVVIIGWVSYFLITQQQSNKEGAVKNEDTMMESKEPDGTMEKKDEDTMMKDESMTKYSGSVVAGSASPLLDFNASDYELALKTDKLVLLYFYANWCPICKAETSNALYPAFNELTADKVIGFRVNYNDNQTDNDEKNLAREFGVAYQHTKVFVKNGERVLKSPESWDKNRYFSEINKY